MYKTYAEKLNQELQALKRFRHDLKKQYFLEQMYLDTGQYDLLKKEYERNGALSFIHAIQGGSSGNMVIDALVANARERAENVGVEFSSEVRVPADLKIQDVHMNRLLGNILENALEAAKDLGWIELILHYDRGNLYIRCKNSFHHELNRDFRTIKKQKKEHGMGLAIIKEIASLYDGNVEVEYKENIFSIQVLLLNVVDYTYFSSET